MFRVMFLIAFLAPTPILARTKPLPYQPELAADLLVQEKTNGDVRRGAIVFTNPKFACVSCHKIGILGGIVGPDLSNLAKCSPPEQIVESVLWPKRVVKEGYFAVQIVTTAGKMIQAYKERETTDQIILRDPATAAIMKLAERP